MNGNAQPGKILAFAAAYIALSASGPCQADAHDKDYWLAVVAHDFTPPADAPLASLLHELSDYLGSSDPELRDDVAYTVLTQWLYVKQIVPPELRRELIAEWTANMRRNIGEQGTESVFSRSFSALMLSVIAALDNAAPYLARAEFEELLQSALSYLRDERDTRGFDAGKGWMHSVAHTADLLKFLSRSRHLEVSEQSLILGSIAEKLTRLDHALVHGEDERLARVLVSIAARPDADLAAFEKFLANLGQTRPEGLPTPAELARNQNCKHLAVSLHAVLAIDKRELESLRQARGMVLTLLDDTME